MGMDADNIDAILDKVYRMQLVSHGAGAAAAIGLSGIDMALWDIRGKLEDKPLFALLGGHARRIPAYAGGVALGYQALPDLLLEIDAALSQGLRALKLRLGDSPSRDIERVRAVRRHVGDEIDILSDVNTAYDLAEIAELMPVLDECKVGWLEEPFPAHDYKSYIAAKSLGTTPLAAGENHYTRFDFERALDDRAITIWQPDLSKTGGITEALRIAKLGQQAGYTIHPHTSHTSLNMAASVHFLSAIDNRGYFEADISTFNPFCSELCSAGYHAYDDGTVAPLDRPGLGVDVDEALIPSFAVIAGPGYV